MELIKLTDNISLQEFIDKNTFNRYKERSTRFLSPIIVQVAQAVRDYFGRPITINNWYWGGDRNYSGYRPPSCGIGAPRSAHRRGMAVDFIVKGLSSKEVQETILNNSEHFMMLGATAMEMDTDGWTHLSCEWFESKDLVLIPNPNKKKEA